MSSATSPKQRSFAPKQQDQLRTLSKLSHGSQSDNSNDTMSSKSLHSQVPVTVTSPAILHDFPRLAQATSTTPLTQACFVPSSTRGYDPNGCLFVLNVPDVVAGPVITEPDVRRACIKARFEGMEDVTRHNYNMFVISLRSRSRAWETDRHLKLDLSMLSAGPTSSNHSSLMVSARRYDEGPHHVFCCAIRTSNNKQSTVYKRVFQALDGPDSASFQLLKQNGTNGYVRYVLRRPASAPPIHVERFHIPIDRASGKGKTWATFQPFKTNRKGPACYERFQVGASSMCPYATLMGKF